MYKRQAHKEGITHRRCLVKLEKMSCILSMVKQIHIHDYLVTDHLQLGEGIMAVSYTHLDVYKRQHMHIVGVPIKDNYTRGMRKQPAKSKVFTKESLQRIQDEMRNCCIKSYNKIYRENSLLKQKKKGRNQDIDVKDMEGYREIKKQLKQKEQKLTEANNQTKKLDDKSNNVNQILDNLKPSKLNKNNICLLYTSLFFVLVFLHNQFFLPYFTSPLLIHHIINILSFIS